MHPQISDYFMARGFNVLRAAPGSGVFRLSVVDFWDLINEFLLAVRSAADIEVADLAGMDFSASSMSVSKRAVVFM
jgi:hypothetical protein